VSYFFHRYRLEISMDHPCSDAPLGDDELINRVMKIKLGQEVPRAKWQLFLQQCMKLAPKQPLWQHIFVDLLGESPR
jgi:hypothetical protein